MDTQTRGYKYVKEQEEERIIELREKGMSALDIADIIGCSESKIYLVLRKHNIESPYKLPKEKIEQIIRMRNEGRTYRDIAYNTQVCIEKARKIYTQYILNY